MGTVTEIDDGLSYVLDDAKKLTAVKWSKRNQFVEFKIDGSVTCQQNDGFGIGKHELKELMTMWLALNYPDVLKFDDEPCGVCEGTKTVCEYHPHLQWEGTSNSDLVCKCGGAGMQCLSCKDA
jgi:hypothetical protein